MDERRTPRKLTNDTSEGGEVEFVHLGLVSEHQSRSSIIQVGSISRRHGPILSKDGLQARDLGGQDLLVLLILGDDGISLARVRESDGRDLGGESTGRPGGSGFRVGGESEGVLVLAGDGVLACGFVGAV